MPPALPGVMTILAEPPVALLDGNADRHGTRAVAQAYLEFLFTEEAQAVAARHHYRPRLAPAASQHPGGFPAIQLFTVAEVAGGWQRAQARHFDEGGIFDQIYEHGAR